MAAPSVKIPSSYTHNLNFQNGLTISVFAMDVKSESLVVGDKNRPVATLLLGDPNQPITTTIQGNEAKPVTTTIQGNKDKPVVSHVDMLNLPHLNKQDLKDLLTPEIRMRIPNYNQISFKILGIELFNVCLSGESQVITEPYVPNAYERCETDCCEPDTRPFPQSTPGIAANPNINTATVVNPVRS